MQKFRQSFIVYEKPGILYEKLKNPITIELNHFCWNLANVSYLQMSTKKCLGFFSFFSDLEVFAKVKKDLVSTHSHKPGFSITQDLNKI